VGLAVPVSVCSAVPGSMAGGMDRSLSHLPGWTLARGLSAIPEPERPRRRRLLAGMLFDGLWAALVGARCAGSLLVGSAPPAGGRAAAACR